MYGDTQSNPNQYVELDTKYLSEGQILCKTDFPAAHLQYLHNQLKQREIFTVDVYYDGYKLYIGFESITTGFLGYTELPLSVESTQTTKVEVVEVADSEFDLFSEVSENIEQTATLSYGITQTLPIKGNSNQHIKFTTSANFILGLAFVTAGTIINVTNKRIEITTNQTKITFDNLTTVMKDFNYFVRDLTFDNWDRITTTSLIKIYKAATTNQQIAFKQYIGIEKDKVFTDNTIVIECDTMLVRNKYYFPINILPIFKGIKSHDIIEVSKKQKTMSIKVSYTHFLFPIEEGAFQSNLLSLIHGKSKFIYMCKLFKESLKPINILQQFTRKEDAKDAEYTIETNPNGIFIKQGSNVAALVGEYSAGCSITVSIDLFKQCLSHFGDTVPDIYLLLDKDNPCVMFSNGLTLIMPAIATSASQELISAMEVRSAKSDFSKLEKPVAILKSSNNPTQGVSATVSVDELAFESVDGTVGGL